MAGGMLPYLHIRYIVLMQHRGSNFLLQPPAAEEIGNMPPYPGLCVQQASGTRSMAALNLLMVSFHKVTQQPRGRKQGP